RRSPPPTRSPRCASRPTRSSRSRSRRGSARCAPGTTTQRRSATATCSRSSTTRAAACRSTTSARPARLVQLADAEQVAQRADRLDLDPERRGPVVAVLVLAGDDEPRADLVTRRARVRSPQLPRATVAPRERGGAMGRTATGAHDPDALAVVEEHVEVARRLLDHELGTERRLRVGELEVRTDPHRPRG